MPDMDAPRLMVETPCEHGFVTEHDGYSSKPLEAGDWGLDGIDPLFHCSGGTREEASVDLILAWLREQGAVAVIDLVDDGMGVVERSGLVDACFDQGPYWNLDAGSYAVVSVSAEGMET